MNVSELYFRLSAQERSCIAWLRRERWSEVDAEEILGEAVSAVLGFALRDLRSRGINPSDPHEVTVIFPEALLWKAMRRKHYDHMRRRDKQPIVSSDIVSNNAPEQPSASVPLELAELLIQCQRFMKSLTGTDGVIFQTVFLEGKTGKAAAARANVSPPTVSRRLSVLAEKARFFLLNDSFTPAENPAMI